MSSLINGIKSMLVIRDDIPHGYRGEVEHTCQARHAWMGLKYGLWDSNYRMEQEVIVSV